jgi:hypothetical protein
MGAAKAEAKAEGAENMVRGLRGIRPTVWGEGDLVAEEWGDVW